MPAFACSSLAEVYVYATCVMLGISMLMPLNAVTSAPAYMVNYYRYVTGDENAVPNNDLFWANILTFYNIISVPTQIIWGPTILLPAMRKLSLNARFIIALTLMMLEVFVLLLMPLWKVSQVNAIVAFVIVTIAAGAGKSYLEATCYALVGTMPPKFMSAVMFGCGFSGVIASVIQCIVKASMANDHKTLLKQAHIYFSLALAFMGTSLVMAICLRYNSYAQEHVGEYRMLRRRLIGEGGAHRAKPFFETTAAECSRRVVLDNSPVEAVQDNAHQKEARLAAAAAGADEKDAVRTVPAVENGGSASEEDNDAQRNMTTAEQLQHTRVWPVIKQIYPMQIACFCVFFVSLFIFPSLVIPIDRTDKWFATLAILCYNCGDATGRLSASIKMIWPSRKALLIASFCRFAFIPLVFLCIYGQIPSHAAPYVFLVAIGLTNGFGGSMAMVLGPETPSLKTDGQRVMAGQLMGLSLLAGASAAALLATLVVVFLPK